MGSVFAGMEIDAEGEYVRHADAAILIDALQRLSEFFIGEWVNDERGQDEIDNEKEAAEGFAKDVLAKLSPLTANAALQRRPLAGVRCKRLLGSKRARQH